MDFLEHKAHNRKIDLEAWVVSLIEQIGNTDDVKRLDSASKPTNQWSLALPYAKELERSPGRRFETHQSDFVFRPIRSRIIGIIDVETKISINAIRARARRLLCDERDVSRFLSFAGSALPVRQRRHLLRSFSYPDAISPF